MASGRTMVEMKGLTELIERVKKMPEKAKKGVDEELTDGAQLIRKEALLLVRTDKAGGSGLRGQMWDDTTEFLSKRVGNKADYAAYQEFGTGLHAAEYVLTLPEDWQVFAKTFFVNGKGRIPAQPFLYPAFETVRPVLIERIKKVLKDAISK